jgi:hypothetical protein
MNKGIENLFNKDLLKLMNEMLDDFILSDSSEDEIYEELRYANESIRVGLYLLSIEKGFIYLSQRLKNVNDRINVEVIELFKEAIDKGNEKKFLSTLGKIDKISLLNHLGINVPEEKKKGLNKVQIKYYKALTDSIKDSQVDDKRDGIDSFLTYKRNKA